MDRCSSEVPGGAAGHSHHIERQPRANRLGIQLSRATEHEHVCLLLGLSWARSARFQSFSRAHGRLKLKQLNRLLALLTVDDEEVELSPVHVRQKLLDQAWENQAEH